MIVKVITRTEKEMERCDYRDAMEIKVDNRCVFKVRDDEPEDSNLGRSFSDVYKIPDLMRMAYEAGKNGEELLIDSVESEDI